jgi:hypothetical protein
MAVDGAHIRLEIQNNHTYYHNFRDYPAWWAVERTSFENGKEPKFFTSRPRTWRSNPDTGPDPENILSIFNSCQIFKKLLI